MPFLYTTHSERVEFEWKERKTIEQLKEEINFMLQSISEEPVKEAFMDAWYCEVLKRKGSTKKDYVAFYEEISFYLDNSIDYLSAIDDEAQ